MKALTSPWGLMLIGLPLFWIGQAADFPLLAGIGMGTMAAGFVVGIINVMRGGK